jgi:hypothetical protein
MVKLQIGLRISILGCLFTVCQYVNAQTDSSDKTCEIDYAALKAMEMAEIEYGVSVYRRAVQDGLSEEDLSDEEAQSVERIQALLKSRTRTVDRHDLIILDNADARLSDISVWDRADDRVCEPQDKTFSLFCSLYFGSIEAIGAYQHRRTALEEIRFAIEDVAVGRKFDHRIMDFNNLPETSFEDIKKVLQVARTRVQDRLGRQARCAP